ncbi:hypothetical protein GCM10023084_52380 [Streptomyces lacrimifluminis]|uniref:Teneurin-like YD-shell domain-containing protein n=1 Tax=Streptomyces lacrimifluminis TaxID=1500077 RepID=A0A917P1Z5_9ACTN|nr:RHS repeat-associated core domain-containing protein [Streptomyces lacrimifluminis]GGJ54425.1 hypothetical protein GCM10012282_59500 [Streptomyces lacrimifluminis]
MRTSTGSPQWQVTDGHDTAETAVDATTQTITRRLDPFGNARGTQSSSGSWLGDKGFVSGVQDLVTGLAHLGAREYDSTTGRFVSDDPVLELTDAQQIDGYTYAADNPVSGSDPTGMDDWYNDPTMNTCAIDCGSAPAPATTTATASSASSSSSHSGGGGGGGGAETGTPRCRPGRG